MKLVWHVTLTRDSAGRLEDPFDATASAMWYPTVSMLDAAYDALRAVST